MGFAQILSRAEQGLTAPLVRVEVHQQRAALQYRRPGCPVVRESRERVRAALALRVRFPAGRTRSISRRPIC
jgi:magnesium chelatase family protein